MNDYPQDAYTGNGLELIPPSKADSTSSEVPISVEEIKSPPPNDSFRLKTADSPNPQLTSVFRGHIVLNPGISPINYYASLIHTIVTFFNLTAATTLQPLILLDKNSFNVNPKEIGVILAELILFQTLTKMVFAPVCGYLADNVGRKAVIFLGAALALMGYILVGFQTSVFPGYAISKLFVANGGNILAIIPLNADYVHDTAKGKATGITQAFTSAGSFLGSLFVTIMLRLKFSLVQIHYGTGIILMSCVLIYSIGIKGGKYFLVRPGQENDQQAIDRASTRNDDKFIVKMRKGMNALSRNGWLLVALVIQTLARADYYLVTIVFSLYVKSYDDTPDEVERSNELISLYQDLFFALGFFGNLVYGFLLDKVSAIKIIMPAMFFAILGYFLVLFADSKDSPNITLLIVFAGFAMPGLFNAANYLGIKHFPRDLRGVLSGIMNMIGVIGYLFLSTVGGYLFDNHGRSSPFLLFLIMLLVSSFLIVFIYRWTVAIERKRMQRGKRSATYQEQGSIKQ